MAPETTLHLVVIGGGLCGLSAAIATRLAGHSVTILEAVPSFLEVGAGLQITPNGTRILRSYGLDGVLGPKAAIPTYMRIRRYSGKLLAERTGYAKEIYERYGSPLWCLHRADLQIGMVDRARELGVVIKLGARVTNIDLGEESSQGHGQDNNMLVTLSSGEAITGDIVIAADGIWSGSRQKLVGANFRPKPTGDLAYRILLDREQISDAKLKYWMEAPGINIWIGPGMHAVAYSIKGGQWLNIVLLVKDDLPEDVRKAQGDLAEMRAIFREWDPILTQFLENVKSVDKWRLNYLKPLPHWKSASGAFLLAGDCAHPMLPYMAQGANSSLEDGATIGAILAKVSRRDQLPAAIEMYDAVRRPRVDQLVRETFRQGREHHLPDGPEQEERDVLLKRSFENSQADGRVSEHIWTHPKIQPWIYSYDVGTQVGQAYLRKPF